MKKTENIAVTTDNEALASENAVTTDNEAATPENAEITTVIETMADYEREIEASFRTINEGDLITGEIIDVTEEEITLDLKYYTQGIIKADEWSDDPNFSVFDEMKIGESITATVISIDDGHGNILLSKKKANDVLAWDKLAELMKERTILTVKVSDANNAGAVAYAEGIRGFIPASQLALSYVDEPQEYIGKTLSVRVQNIDRNREKLILSAKDVLMETEAEEHAHKVAMIVPGTIVKGTVESLQNYGAFIDIGDGLTGLCHVSQICERRIRTPQEELKVGQKVTVKILNTNDGKISLSIKAALEEESAREAQAFVSESMGEAESVGTSLGAMLAGFKFD